MNNLNKPGWHFSTNTNRMHVKLPYEEALDSDEATIKATLGREKIQNSLDACLDKTKPVQMSFDWISFDLCCVDLMLVWFHFISICFV